jgi:peptidoglycan hydrolase CwlO-like protein
MRRLFFALTAPMLSLAILLAYSGQKSMAYDISVYNNLMKSRDALTQQQAELQRAYDETQKQIDNLNQKLSRIDSYLKQVNSSIKDVDTALLYAKQ